MDIFSLPQSLLGWLTLGALAIVGVLAILGSISKVRKEREKETAKADDRLINLLNGTVSAMEKEVGSLRDQQKLNTVEISKLRGENDMMTKIFQGRDTRTDEFMTQGFEAMKKSSEILDVVKSTNDLVKFVAQKVTEGNSHIEKLYQVIEKYLSDKKHK